MTNITFKNLINLTQDHPDFSKLIFKRLKAYDSSTTGLKYSSLKASYPSLREQMDIFSEYLTHSAGGIELIFEINGAGIPVKSTHEGRKIAERTYIAHNSRKNGKLMTNRESTGEATVDKVGSPISSKKWSGTNQTSWSIVARLVGELYDLIDVNNIPDSHADTSGNKEITGDQRLTLRTRLAEYLTFLDTYAPDYSEKIYTDLWQQIDPLIQRMKSDASNLH